jgi:23S rRNA pseudoU1915 N3-methylase RlmH
MLLVLGFVLAWFGIGFGEWARRHRRRIWVKMIDVLEHGVINIPQQRLHLEEAKKVHPDLDIDAELKCLDSLTKEEHLKFMAAKLDEFSVRSNRALAVYIAGMVLMIIDVLFLS